MRPLRPRSLFLLLAVALSFALTYGCAKAGGDGSIPSAGGTAPTAEQA
jgi:hypothetical protein